MIDDLHTLAVDLIEGGATVGLRILPVLHRGANNIVRDARAHAPGAGGTGAAKRYPSTITYDIDINAGSVAAEIGPDRDLNGQAKLGNIFEYGTSAQPPHPHLDPALDRESPKFEAYAAEAASKFL